MALSRKRSSKGNLRTLRLESLERRNLLAGDVFHNYLSPGDVNNDSQVSVMDALTVINRLHRFEASGQGEQTVSSSYADVNDDGYTTVLDALMVINQLDRDAGSSVMTGEELKARIAGVSGQRAKIEIENKHGGSKLEVKIQNALPFESYDVTVANSVVATLVTNSRGRASLEMFLTGSVAETLAAANAGTSVSISGIGASVFGGERAGDDGDGKTDTTNSHVNDHGDRDDDVNHGHSSATGSNDSDDDLNNGANRDSSSNPDHSSQDVDSESSSAKSSESNTVSNNAANHGLDDSADSDDGMDHVIDDASRDSDNDDAPLTPSATGTIYGEWKAQLTGAGVGKVEFEIERGEMEFEVEVRGFEANSNYLVSVDGVVIGQLRTNSRGKGKLKFEIGDYDHRPFPANFPTITAGTSVSVGDRVSGVFSAKLNDHDDDDRDSHDEDDHDD